MDSDLFVQLTPARKVGRQLLVRRSAIIAIEQDPEPDRASYPRGQHGNNQTTLVRLAGCDYIHLVEETPEQIVALLASQSR